MEVVEFSRVGEIRLGYSTPISFSAAGMKRDALWCWILTLPTRLKGYTLPLSSRDSLKYSNFQQRLLKHSRITIKPA